MELSDLSINNPAFENEFSDISYIDRDVSKAGEVIQTIARALLGWRGFPLTISFMRVSESNLETLISIYGENKDLLRILRIGEPAVKIYKKQCETQPNDVFGFTYIEALSAYITKLVGREAIVLTDVGRTCTLIITSSWTLSSANLYASLVPAMLPWAFASEPVQTDELEVLTLLANPNTEYMAWAQPFEAVTEKRYGFKDRVLEVSLGGFESAVNNILLRQYKNQIDDLERSVRDYTERLTGCIINLNEAKCMLSALENTKPQEGQLLQYFKGNPKLNLIQARNEIITFVICCYMDLFDPDAYQIMKENEYSYLYSGYNDCYRDGALSEDEYWTLMDGLFSTERVKLKLCAAWKLTQNSISALESSEYVDRFPDYMPNPHIQGYGCTGSFGSYLNGSIQRGDYVMALDTACVDTGNVNLNDSVVTRRQFIPYLIFSGRKIIELPDGTSVTTREAIKWLKETEE